MHRTHHLARFHPIEIRAADRACRRPALRRRSRSRRSSGRSVVDRKSPDRSFAPSGPERSSCVPDSSQAMSSGCCVCFVVEVRGEKEDLAVLVRPGRGEFGRRFSRGPSGVCLPGTKVTASTQAGAACALECARIVLAQIEPRAVRRGLGGLAAGLRIGSRSAAERAAREARIAARRKNASAAKRKSIAGGEINSVRAKLQTMRHLEDRRENAVNHEADHDRDQDDDDRRNQGRDDLTVRSSSRS